jgi:hypothetical protein
VILFGDDGIAAYGPPAEVLRDTALLESCRLLPTSLLEANLAAFASTNAFLRAEDLAHRAKEVM